MGIEGFVIDGRTFMYFGPFPALLRIPVLQVTAGLRRRDDRGLDAAGVDRPRRVHDPPAVAGADRRPGAGRARHDAAGGARRDLPGRRHRRHHGDLRRVARRGSTTRSTCGRPRSSSPRRTGWCASACVPPGAAWPGSGVLALCAVLTRTTGGWGVCAGALALGIWMLRGRSFAGARRLGPWVIAAGLRAPGRRRRLQHGEVRPPLPVPAAGPGVDHDQPAPSVRAGGQRRHDHRAAVLQLVVRDLLRPARHPLRRLLPLDHPARRERHGHRRCDRPVLPHRQRDRVHAAVAADGPRGAAGRVPPYSRGCRPARASGRCARRRSRSCS